MPIINEEPLQKYNPSEFNFDRMKVEVSGAMKEDWKRDKVDDAKKKAIYDSKNYDEFKARVAGCTLKPIHRNEFNEPPKFAYNRQAASKEEMPGQVKEIQPIVVPVTKSFASNAGVIRNGRELDRELRKLKSSEARAILIAEQLLSDEDVQRVFAKELDAEVFRQLLIALEEAEIGTIPRGTARKFLTQIVLLCPNQASQAASFFGNEERGLIARLLARDEADPREDVIVCATFGVPPSSVGEAAIKLGLRKTEEGSMPPVASCEDMD